MSKYSVSKLYKIEIIMSSQDTIGVYNNRL